VIAMNEPSDLEAQAERIRRNRNRVMALLLAGFAILVFFISIAKMS